MKLLTLTMILLCLGTVEAHPQDSHDSDAESRVLALERIARVQACETKDLKTLDAMLDEAFVYVGTDGRLLTKPEVLANIQGMNSIQFAAEAMVVKIHGDTAIVTGLYRIKHMDRGKPILQRGRFVDTWLYKNDRWLAIASLSTPNSE
jgi:ketosteroid isomerase-like protein